MLTWFSARDAFAEYVWRAVSLWIAGFSVFVFTCASNDGSLCAQSPPGRDPQQLLQRCLASQARLERCAMRVKAEIEMRRAGKPPHRYQNEVLIRRDGRLLDISGWRVFARPEDGRSHRIREVAGRDKHVGYVFDSKGQRIISAIVAVQQMDDVRRRFLHCVEYGMALDGYLPITGGKRLGEMILESGQARYRGEEQVGGVACSVVEAKTDHGTMVVWINQSQSHAVMKVDIRKGPKNLFSGGKRVSEQPMDVYGNRRLIGWSGVLDEVKLSIIDGMHVPVAGRLVDTHYFQGGSTDVGICTYARSDIDLHPNFEGTDAFVTTDVPENELVTNHDDRDSGVVYRWQQGKVVPAYTGFTGQAKGSWHPRSMLARMVLTLVSLAIFVGLLWWIARRRFAGRP